MIVTRPKHFRKLKLSVIYQYGKKNRPGCYYVSMTMELKTLGCARYKAVFATFVNFKRELTLIRSLNSLYE